MNESKTENEIFSDWLDMIDNVRLNLNEIVMITFSDQNIAPITLHLKSGVSIVVPNVTANMSDREVFELLSDYLKAKVESDERIKVNSFELLKSILSELKSISEKL